MTEQNQNQEMVVLGTLEPAELQFITGLRMNSDRVVTEIGRMEVQKARYLGELARIEGQIHAKMTDVGNRLGIAKGTPWQIAADGKAIQTGPANVVQMPTAKTVEAPKVAEGSVSPEEAPKVEEVPKATVTQPEEPEVTKE